tara:strand:- start:417 stop:821 length:405 start_codon:yes stop_codon:yes gene_type:complete
MNPQLNKVFTKIAKAENKTELASEKVELALADEFKGILKAADVNYKASEKMVSEASALNSASLNILQKQTKLDETAANINKNADDLYKRFQSLAKDLGINPKDTPAYKTYNDILSKLLSRSNEKSVRSVLKMRL